MTAKTLDARLMFKTHPQDFPAFESFVKMAILDPAKQVRSKAIGYLSQIYKKSLRGVFSGDNQLFLQFQTGDRINTLYVCDMPQTYIGQPSRAVPFKIGE
ncbi:MAG: hypothetical protein WCK90_01450 [archaeon]